MPSFRLDRFLTLYFFHSLVRSGIGTGRQGIPILMYHSISDEREDDLHPYYRINTSSTVFAEHMRFLSEHDYSVIDLKALDNFYKDNNKPEANHAVISFDDGYRDFYACAFPILQKYNWPATVFLPTSYIGTGKKHLKGKEHLNWRDVNELAQNGVCFGSHSVTHPIMSSLKEDELEYELRVSKEVIEDKTGKKAENFSYPFRFPEEDRKFTAKLVELLQKIGYRSGVSTRIGTTSKGDDKYSRMRLPVNSDDDILFFKAKLEGAYDWMHKPQYLMKRVRKL